MRRRPLPAAEAFCRSPGWRRRSPSTVSFGRLPFCLPSRLPVFDRYLAEPDYLRQQAPGITGARQTGQSTLADPAA